jgi:ribosomal protein L40E
MPSHNRIIWDSEIDSPPAVRGINLAYEKIDKILLSFSINLSDGSFFDPSRGIVVNKKPLEIKDLPQNAQFLSVVDRSEDLAMDVTELLKYSPKGENNLIEVNYRIKKKKFSTKKPAGKLKLYLTIKEPEPEQKIVEVTSKTSKEETKFCMHCGRAIPKDALYCCYCSLAPPPGGEVPKSCRNCETLLPPIAVYCEKCGNLQPEAQSFSEPQPPTAVTESEASPPSGSGLPDTSSSSPI